jgi:succinyl-CoA synthetase beta subunit
VPEADAAARELGGKVWVVKAQIHAGGRGKGGGVKVAKSLEEVHEYASQILGMTLVTHQTGPQGRLVRRLLVEEGADIRKELYVGMVVDRGVAARRADGEFRGRHGDRGSRGPHAREDTQGGHRSRGGIDRRTRPMTSRARSACRRHRCQARNFMHGLYRAFVECDASLAEINPLILTGDGKVLALDAKLNFDDNALFRHPEIVALRDLDEEDPAEVEASKFDLSYISLDGNIGCLVNGAGLAMATMDAIKLFGAEPANFLDVGGGATTQKVTEAFKLMLKNPAVKGILVNIFGGIMRCDTIAEGVIAAAKEVKLGVPLVVRMKGTNEELGRQLLKDIGAADHFRRQHGGCRAKDRRRRRRKVGASCMSILIDRNTRVMTQGITGKTGAFHTRLCRDYANGKACFVAGVNPNKAGENFEGIPIFGRRERKRRSAPERRCR